MINKVNPDHYQKKSMECKDLISVMLEGLDGAEAYYMGNILKYLYRYKDKGGAEDLRKARQYLEFLIDEYEGILRSWGAQDPDVECPNCGSIFQAGELYCPSCGQEIPLQWEYKDTDSIQVTGIKEETTGIKAYLNNLFGTGGHTFIDPDGIRLSDIFKTPEDEIQISSRERYYDPSEDPYRPLPLWDNSDLTTEDYEFPPVGRWLSEDEVSADLSDHEMIPDEETASARYFSSRGKKSC